MPRKAAIMASRTIEKAVTGKSPMQARMRAGESRIQHRRCTAMIQMSMTGAARKVNARRPAERSEEHTAELQSLMRTSYAVFCLKKKKKTKKEHNTALNRCTQ